MEMEKCYRKDSSMVARKVAEELILVPIRQNVGDLQCIYTMNGVGVRIWDLLNGENTPASIVSVLSEEYEVERKHAEADVIGFLEQLESVGAIISA